MIRNLEPPVTSINLFVFNNLNQIVYNVMNIVNKKYETGRNYG